MRIVVMSVAAAVVFVPASIVWATDRPVTEPELSKLAEAVKAAGCSAGKMEFDDDKDASHPNGKFEVDDAICDGKKHDLAFDVEFKLLKKKPD